MFLTGLVHREKLFEIALRWFHDELKPEDGRKVTEIFLFENLISGPVVRDGLLRLLKRLHPGRLKFELIRDKDRIRNIVIEGLEVRTPRIAELIANYQANPEEYYPKTPVDALIFWNMDHQPVAVQRIKRIRRVTEKVSRRVADHLLGQILEEAEKLAQARAAAQGGPLKSLVSTPEEMARDFNEGERIVASRFRDGKVAFNPSDIQVDDVIGLKIIGNEKKLAEAEEILASFPDISIIDREVHQGRYNAVHLLVDMSLPPFDRILRHGQDIDWSMMAHRGISPEILAESFVPYLFGAAPSFHVEVILTTYDEFVESELGRSIHEDHILRLRETRTYRGRIAKNAEFITEYLLALAFSPRLDVEEIPFKLWGHYLPDTLSYAIRHLYNQEELGILNLQMNPLSDDGVWEI